MQRTFIPKQNVRKVYEIPTEENDEPAYESESEYTSGSYHSDDEQVNLSETETEDEIPAPTPVKSNKRRKVVLESSDEELPQPKKGPATITHRKTATSEAIRKEEEDLNTAIEQSLAESKSVSTGTGIMVDDRISSTADIDDDDDMVVVVQVEWC